MLDQRGFSLMEALTAATISVIAVLGLAYSFGVGRGMVNRYEIARAAMAEAQTQLEAMTVMANDDPQLTIGFRSPQTPFRYEGVTLGNTDWIVLPYDEPNLSGPANLRRVVVTVRWRQDSRLDSLSLERLWQP